MKISKLRPKVGNFEPKMGVFQQKMEIDYFENIFDLNIAF